MKKAAEPQTLPAQQPKNLHTQRSANHQESSTTKRERAHASLHSWWSRINYKPLWVKWWVLYAKLKSAFCRLKNFPPNIWVNLSLFISFKYTHYHTTRQSDIETQNCNSRVSNRNTCKPSALRLLLSWAPFSENPKVDNNIEGDGKVRGFWSKFVCTNVFVPF